MLLTTLRRLNPTKATTGISHLIAKLPNPTTPFRPLTTTTLITLEVERKFTPTPASLRLLRTNTCSPRFTSHAYLGHRTIADTYYDKARIFMDRGIYVRRRNGVWEVKVGGDSHLKGKAGEGSEVFDEYADIGAIRRLVQGKLRSAGQRGGSEGIFAPPTTEGDGAGEGDDGVMQELDPVAEIVVRRDEWDVDGLRVVVDETQWGYTVGEVELTREGFEGQKEDAVKVMDEKVMAFMREHGDVFLAGGEGRPIGKLSAYWMWEKEKEDNARGQMDV